MEGMNDTISRQAAIDALIAEGRNVDSCYLESERIIHESDAVEVISMLPSVDRIATWVPEPDRRNHWHCSKCGYVIGILKVDAKYCLNCGCQMLEGENDA